MVALVALLGCSGPESSGVWMESSGFRWEFFNHRVSHLELGVTDESVFASIVGGTSTTGVVTQLDDGCNPDTCDEFPFFDNAEIVVGWARATSTKTVFGAGAVELVVDADGETSSLSIELPEKGRGAATAIVRGYSFDTQEPLAGGEACYRPANGWLPKGFGIALGEPVLSDDGRSVSLDVTGHFEAGPTFEDERQCLDAVVDQARVPLRVDVLVAVTKGDAESIPVDHGLSYTFSGDSSDPGEQPDPDWAERPLGTSIADPLTGWSQFDFTFHEEGQSRGGYIRSLYIESRVDDDIASGHSTNYSPVTQLSAFDYVFQGTVEAVDIGAEIERGEIAESIEVELGGDGVPVVVEWAL